MVGYDAVGAIALGELSGDLTDTIVFVPAAVNVAAAKVAPIVSGGGSVFGLPKSVTVTVAAPAIRAGVRVLSPGIAVAVSSTAGSVEISATITAPAVAIIVTSAAAAIDGGAKVAVPAASAVSTTRIAPAVTAGKSVFPSVVGVIVAGAAPRISISATLHPTTQSVTVQTLAPQILGGNYIEANNTITMITPYGEIASVSIGQFAIGEGENSTRIVKRGPLILVATSPPPLITAGKSVFPPSAAVTAASARAEIDSRRRKIRILAIAS